MENSVDHQRFFLTDKDFHEFRHALKTIAHYLQSDLICNQKQKRLSSPYYNHKVNNDSHLLLPLCTNEYFIRNGLLNHNDRPDIFSSTNVSPLTLFSNRKHSLTTLTSNCHVNEYDETQLRRNKVRIWERDFILRKPNNQSNSCLSSLRTCSQKDGNNQLFPMIKTLGRK